MTITSYPQYLIFLRYAVNLLITANIDGGGKTQDDLSDDNMVNAYWTSERLINQATILVNNSN